MSEPERVLWMLLRGRRFAAYKFRRQVPLGAYVADFVCFDRKLVVELDGLHHQEDAQAAHDAVRTETLEAGGFRVVRVWAGDLLGSRDAALEAILQALER